MLALTRSHVHLPGLNGIRAIAALIVVMLHIDQFARLFGLPSLGYSRSGFGAYAVIVFFVLSGYLITYLLLVEKADCGRIDIHAFYVQRILRIWPLYYLSLFTAAILLATAAVTAERGATGTLLFYGLLLSNVGYALGYGVRMILPLWSIGVEEQFYAFWPIVIDRARSPARALLGILIGYLAIKLGARFSGSNAIYNVVLTTPYGCMAIGGLMGVAARSGSPRLRLVFAPAVQIVCWLALAFSLVSGPLHLFSVFDHELNAIVYAVIIANVSVNPRTIISLEHRGIDAVGQISYGIYMLHFPWLLLTAYLLHNRAGVALPRSPAGYGIMYATVIGGTLLLAAASYRWFERPFLRMKSRYSIIETVPALPAEG